VNNGKAKNSQHKGLKGTLWSTKEICFEISLRVRRLETSDSDEKILSFLAKNGHEYIAEEDWLGAAKLKEPCLEKSSTTCHYGYCSFS
jgi:hypothetical protein